MGGAVVGLAGLDLVQGRGGHAAPSLSTASARKRRFIGRAPVRGWGGSRGGRGRHRRCGEQGGRAGGTRHALEFLDLVGACQRFVAATGRIVPSLRERRFSEDERETVHRNVDRVRATCEWITTAVDTGEVDVDEELAKLLRGE
ncbi:DUF6192 family protein [Streptomyces mirabilis]|uniref:DUF6192 family protein n=1 Tax=Streptomyces mirabilis TaxID=68239 RepID=UPI0036B0DC75